MNVKSAKLNWRIFCKTSQIAKISCENIDFYRTTIWHQQLTKLTPDLYSRCFYLIWTCAVNNQMRGNGEQWTIIITIPRQALITAHSHAWMGGRGCFLSLLVTSLRQRLGKKNKCTSFYSQWEFLYKASR